jgi:hypothetical protein
MLAQKEIKKTGSALRKSVFRLQKIEETKFFPSSFGAVVGSGMDKNHDPGFGINIQDPQN